MKQHRNMFFSFLSALALHAVLLGIVIIAGGAILVPVFKDGDSGIMVTLADDGIPAVSEEAVAVVVKEIAKPFTVQQMETPVVDPAVKPIPHIQQVQSPKPLVFAVEPAPTAETPAGSVMVDTSNTTSKPVASAAESAVTPVENSLAGGASSGVKSSVDSGSFLDIHPSYPPGAQKRGEEGLVVVKAVINSRGRAESVEIVKSSGYTSLDQSAVSAMKRARFVARNGGTVKAGEITQPFVYKLVSPQLN